MSFDLSLVTLVGNVGGDAELRYTPNGHAVANFNVAVNPPRRPDEESDANWYRVTVWGKRAETADQLVTKGTRIFVSGRLTLNFWIANDGTSRPSLDVNATEFVLLGSRDGNQGATNQPPQRPATDYDDGLPF